MANLQTSGINAVMDVCKEYDIACQFEGKSMPTCASSLDIHGVHFNSLNQWDADGLKELASFIRCCIEEEGMTSKQLKKELINYNTEGWLEIFGEYAKDSYQDSLYSLKDLLKLAMNECAYAVDKWQDVADKRASHEYKSTESAFIYKGYYITPCILKHALNSVIKNIKNDNMIKFYALYYGGCKVKNDVIIEDCLKDLFVNDSNERLVMLDELSGHELININQVRSQRM